MIKLRNQREILKAIVLKRKANRVKKLNYEI
jgi:hypothetical protein